MITKVRYYIEYDTWKKVHDEYGLFNTFCNKDLLGHYIYKLYDDNQCLSLSDFFSQMLSAEEYEIIKNDRKKQFEITIEYLSIHLKNWNLKMKTFEHEEDITKTTENYTEYILKWTKEWRQVEIEEWVKYVCEKWNSCKNDKERSHFEDWGVMFTLPENDWMY